MASDLVGQHQLTTFTTPSNGQSPIDANQVKGNDNTIKTSYNAHDSDYTIHFQSSTAAAKPSAATAGNGAKWFEDDTYKIFLSDGSAWHEAAYLPSSGTITGPITITGTLTATDLVATASILSGSTITASYASAQIIANATTGNPAFTFQRAGVQAALVASGAADEIDFLNHLGVSMGNVIAGAWSLPGNLAINTNKFTVAAGNGNTLVAGTLGVTGAITGPSVAVTGALTGQSAAVTAGLTSSGATGAGIGYATGAGSAVTQSTSYSNPVTINTLCGEIITAGGTLTPQTGANFTVTNSTVAIGDVVTVAIRSGSVSDGTIVQVQNVAAGSFKVRIFNAATGTNETGAFAINFAVVKAVTA